MVNLFDFVVVALEDGSVRSMDICSKNGLADARVQEGRKDKTTIRHIRSDNIFPRNGIDRIEPHGTEDVPGAHLPTVFVLLLC